MRSAAFGRLQAVAREIGAGEAPTYGADRPVADAADGRDGFGPVTRSAFSAQWRLSRAWNEFALMSGLPGGAVASAK